MSGLVCERRDCLSAAASTRCTIYLPHLRAPERRALCPEHRQEVEKHGLLNPPSRRPIVMPAPEVPPTPAPATPKKKPEPLHGAGIAPKERARLLAVLEAAAIPEALADGKRLGMVPRVQMLADELRTVESVLDTAGIPEEHKGKALTTPERVALGLERRFTVEQAFAALDDAVKKGATPVIVVGDRAIWVADADQVTNTLMAQRQVNASAHLGGEGEGFSEEDDGESYMDLVNDTLDALGIPDMHHSENPPGPSMTTEERLEALRDEFRRLRRDTTDARREIADTHDLLAEYKAPRFTPDAKGDVASRVRMLLNREKDHPLMILLNEDDLLTRAAEITNARARKAKAEADIKAAEADLVAACRVQLC